MEEFFERSEAIKKNSPFPYIAPEIDRMVIGISELKDTPRRCQY